MAASGYPTRKVISIGGSNINTHLHQKFDDALRYYLYPLLAVITLAYLAHELSGPQETLGHHYGWYAGGMVIVMVLVEMLHPIRSEWRMTQATFWRRDLPFIILGSGTIVAVNYFTVTIVTQYSFLRGTSHEGIPLLLGIILALLTTDFLWYWVHRICHEARGSFGQFLWRVHAVHHLPRQVYVLMQSVGHPINVIVVRLILTLPLYALGFSPEVVFAASVIIAFQGLVSHFNVDSRVGWLNYLLVGTELHRYHHSADASEAKNFGAVVSVWDQLFGTFYYRPGKLPKLLGVDNPSLYPSDTKLLDVVAYPFRHHKSTDTL